jgi:hypothetical protein
MKKKRIFYLLLVACQYSNAQLPKQTVQQIDSLLNGFAAARQFSGTVLVARHDTIVYQRAMGYASKKKRF